MTIQEWATRHNIPPLAFAELQSILSPFTDTFGTPGEVGSEAAVQQQIRLEAPRIGAAMWRNNNGAAMDADGRMIRYGLGNDSKKINTVWKSSDLIGITPVTHAGRTFGVFTATEVKKPGWHRQPADARATAQAHFMANVKALGGMAGFAQSVEDYREITRG